MSNDLSTPPERSQRTRRLWQGLAIGAASLAVLALVATIAWVTINAPQTEMGDGADQPCGYYWSPGDPYPYIPQSLTQPSEPTSIAAYATDYVQAYPGNGEYGFDFDGNATAYAIYAPTANAHATRCAGLNTEERQTEVALYASYSFTQGAQVTLKPIEQSTATHTPTATMTPQAPFSYPAPDGTSTEGRVIVVVVTATPFETFTLVPSITPTPSATLPAESPTPAATLVSDPAAAGLAYSYESRFWRIGPDGVHDGSILLTQATGGLDPTLQYELFLSDQDLWFHELRSGDYRNLTPLSVEWEEDFTWWPARPGTIAYVFRDLATPGDPPSALVPYLGTINLDGSDPRRLGILGDYNVESYSLGSDGDSIAFFDELTLVRYRLSDGSRQTFTLDSLGLDTPCRSAFGPGFSPDMRFIATRCIFKVGDELFDVATLIVDLETGQGRILDRHAVPPAGREWATTSVVWSKDGQYLITAGEVEFETPYRVIQASEGALVAVLPGRPELFSPDGQWLLLRAVAPDAPAPWFLVDTATWARWVPLAIPEWADHIVWP